MAVNAVSFTLNGTAVTARNAEYTGTPFTDPPGDGTISDPYLGGNRAGSCAAGVGIATANGQCKLSDWTVLDQHGEVRVPQDSQHIGGSGLGAGTEYLTTETPINAILAADVNDTFSLVTEGAGWIKNTV
jgi:hypothetical protein